MHRNHFEKNKQAMAWLEITKHGISPFSPLASKLPENRDSVCLIYDVPGTRQAR